MKKFIEENGLSGYPVGLGGCRISDSSFDSCDYDVFVFDEKSESDKITKYDDEFVILHHASLSESQSQRQAPFQSPHLAPKHFRADQ